MFNESTESAEVIEPTTSPARPAFEALQDMVMNRDAFLESLTEGFDGPQKRKHGRKKKSKKKNRRADRLEQALLLQAFRNGCLKTEKDLLETMLRLSLAASTGRLRNNVLEVGFQLLEGK